MKMRLSEGVEGCDGVRLVGGGCLEGANVGSHAPFGSSCCLQRKRRMRQLESVCLLLPKGRGGGEILF